MQCRAAVLQQPAAGPVANAGVSCRILREFQKSLHKSELKLVSSREVGSEHTDTPDAWIHQGDAVLLLWRVAPFAG